MHKVAGIGGLFFRADDPQALGQWYQDHLGIDAVPGGWQPEGGPTVFMPFEAQTEYFGRETQGWMINFRVDDLDGICAQLMAAGIEIMTDPNWNSEVGRFVRIHDPEGNPIELWEPAPSIST